MDENNTHWQTLWQQMLSMQQQGLQFYQNLLKAPANDNADEVIRFFNDMLNTWQQGLKHYQAQAEDEFTQAYQAVLALLQQHWQRITDHLQELQTAQQAIYPAWLKFAEADYAKLLQDTAYQKAYAALINAWIMKKSGWQNA